MMLRSGVLVSQTVWFGAAPWYIQHDWKGWVAGFLFSAIGSALPDIEHHSSAMGAAAGKWTQRFVLFVSGGHRMGTHSLLGVYLVWLACQYLLGDSVQGQTVSDALAIGMLCHMFTDLLTVQGIALFYGLGLPFIMAGKFLMLFRSSKRTGRIFVRFGRFLHRKTQVGWMTTNSVHELRFRVAVRVVGVSLLLGYGLLLVPGVAEWTDHTITTTISEVRAQ